MKIVIIQPRISYFVGGSEKVATRHIEYLSKNNKVVLYTLKFPEKEESFFYTELKSKNIKNLIIREFEVPKRYKYLYKIKPGQDQNRWDTESLFFNRLISDKLKKEKADIFFNYYIVDGLFKPIDVPNVLYIGGYPKEKIEIYKSFLKFYDATVSNSKNVHDKWGEEIKEVPKNYILRKGVDYPKEVVEVNEIVFNKKYNITFAGRIIKRKGLVTLLNSIKLILNTNQDIHLWILGRGPFEKEIKNLAKKLKIEKNITFTGLVKNPEYYFKHSDLCVFPSYIGEGLMSVVVEVMSIGGVVISTTGVGNEEIIKNEINGVLIEPKKDKILAEKIIFLLKNPHIRKKIGKNAQKFVSKNLTWEQSIDDLNNILREIKKDTTLPNKTNPLLPPR